MLADGDIHLWFTFYDDNIGDELLQRRYRALLNEQERSRELRFHLADDRRRYLTTRALVRTVLSRYASVRPEDWVFSTNAYGRPEIANRDVRESRLSFNISHTRKLIVLAVTLRCALGVDVENVRARHISMDIAESIFSSQEVTALARLPPHKQKHRFFENWTFKESYIKARGTGFALPLDKFSFYYPRDSEVQISIHPDLKDSPHHWMFWQLRPTPDYLVALCAERVNTKRIIVAKTTIPTVADYEFMPSFIRTSG